MLKCDWPLQTLDVPSCSLTVPSILCANINESDSLSETGTNTTTQSNESSEEEFVASTVKIFKPTTQNRKSWPNLTRICERYSISNRAGAAIANSALQDVGIINENNKTLIIEKAKLSRERQKYRHVIREEENKFFDLVNSIYLDGTKDSTIMMTEGENRKRYVSTQLEEHYVIVREPGEFYLGHSHLKMVKGK